MEDERSDTADEVACRGCGEWMSEESLERGPVHHSMDGLGGLEGGYRGKYVAPVAEGNRREGIPEDWGGGSGSEHVRERRSKSEVVSEPRHRELTIRPHVRACRCLRIQAANVEAFVKERGDSFRGQGLTIEGRGEPPEDENGATYHGAAYRSITSSP